MPKKDLRKKISLTSKKSAAAATKNHIPNRLFFTSGYDVEKRNTFFLQIESFAKFVIQYYNFLFLQFFLTIHDDISLSQSSK